MVPIRIAIVGMGKIACDQHLPAIAGNPTFDLAATASPEPASTADVPHFASLAALMEEGPPIDAVAICTPPQVRHRLAAQALDRGLHVFLEKPPGATLSEVQALQAQAMQAGATLFTAWHSRFAGGVAQARDWLAERTIDRLEITWREDVRVWHPGQAWIWEPGGLGVFDPGINALSILTHIVPRPVFLRRSALSFPANRAAPIAADLTLTDATGTPIHMDIDWRQTGPQTWDIVVDTPDGQLTLSRGGAVLSLPSGVTESADREYAGLYAHFAELIQARTCDVDLDPLRLVADAFLCGHRTIVEPFYDPPAQEP